MAKMHLQQQSETYEEEAFDEDEEFDPDEEGSEDTEAKPTTIFGIEKKKFVLILAVLLIVILTLVVLAVKKKGSSGESEYVDTLPTDDAAMSTDFYGIDGTVVGSVDGNYEGATVYDLSGNIIGYVSESGTMEALDATGSVMFMYTSTDSETEETLDDSTDASGGDDGIVLEDTQADTTVVDDELSYEPEDESDEYVFDITKAVKDTSALDELNLSDGNLILKSYGYTGDEIALAQSLGLSVEQLVSAAQVKRDAVTAESLERMSDHASKEFQLMYDYSQYSMPHYNYYPIDDYADSWILKEGSFMVNSDYEKCPTYGYQLQLKVKVANNTYAYMSVTPQRWKELDSEGNMVVKVYYSLYGPTKKKAHLYITDIIEVDTTSHSVNASDSGSSLSDLVDTGTEDPVDGEDEENSTDIDTNDDGVIWN